MTQAERELIVRIRVLGLGGDDREITAGRLLVAPERQLNFTANGVEIGNVFAGSGERFEGFLETAGGAQAERRLHLIADRGFGKSRHVRRLPTPERRTI